MSWRTCYSGSNNIHFDSPPIMMDGRNYASWQPEAVINKRIQTQEGINNNWNYRKFMQNNGLEIMKFNNMQSCYTLGLESRFETSSEPASNVPYKFRNVFDTGTPGFGYNTSDLKNPYLTREQLNARLIAPSINMN
jgi:hypothetical protein